MVLQFTLGLAEEDIILIPTEIKLMLKDALRPHHQELQSPILQKSTAHRNLLVQVNHQVTNQGHQNLVVLEPDQVMDLHIEEDKLFPHHKSPNNEKSSPFFDSSVCIFLIFFRRCKSVVWWMLLY